MSGLRVGPSAYGRGVFATRHFKKGEVVEDAPVVVLDARERQRTLATKLRLYTFEWEGDCTAVVLGLGGLYNHSDEPNLDQRPVVAQQIVRFTALRDVAPGEELTHDYGYDPVEAERWYQRRYYRAGGQVTATPRGRDGSGGGELFDELLSSPDAQQP